MVLSLYYWFRPALLELINDIKHCKALLFGQMISGGNDEAVSTCQHSALPCSFCCRHGGKSFLTVNCKRPLHSCPKGVVGDSLDALWKCGWPCKSALPGTEQDNDYILCCITCSGWFARTCLLFDHKRHLLCPSLSPLPGPLFISTEMVLYSSNIHQGVVHRSVRASHILISDTGAAVLGGLR